MPQPLHSLRGADKTAGAAADRVQLASLRIQFANGMTSTNRTNRREDECFVGSEPHFKNRAQNLRDNISRALNSHGIADADILADDFILVVKRSILHNDA